MQIIKLSNEAAKKDNNTFLNFKYGFTENMDHSILYVYQISDSEKTIHGLISCVNICSSNNKKNIFQHEEIHLNKKEELLSDFLLVNAQNTPILMAHQVKKINELLDSNMNELKKIAEKTIENDITHSILMINNKGLINKIVYLAKDIQHLLIADGHHRFNALSEYYKDHINGYVLGALFHESVLSIKKNTSYAVNSIYEAAKNGKMLSPNSTYFEQRIQPNLIALQLS